MKIDKELKDKIITYLELGLSLSDVMTLTDLTVEQFHSICTKYSEVNKAKQIGVKKSNVKVIEALLKSATGYEIEESDTIETKGRQQSVLSTTTNVKKKHIQPNIKAIQMWLHNRDNDWLKDDMDEAERNMNIKVTVQGKDIIVSSSSNNDEQ